MASDVSLSRISETIQGCRNFQDSCPFARCEHNHSVGTAASISYRKVSPEAKAALEIICEDAKTAREAYDRHRKNIETAITNWTAPLLPHMSIDTFSSRSMASMVAHSSICPTLEQVRYILRQHDMEKYGSRYGSELWDTLDAVFCALGEAWLWPCAGLHPSAGNDRLLALGSRLEAIVAGLTATVLSILRLGSGWRLALDVGSPGIWALGSRKPCWPSEHVSLKTGCTFL